MDITTYFLKNPKIGFAHHKIILDDNGVPVDYEFIDVNETFERTVGKKRPEIIGKTVLQVLPDTINSKFDWIGTFGRIALEGGEHHFEQYYEFLDKWFDITVFSTEPLFFTTIFFDITDYKINEKRLFEKNQFISSLVNTIPIPIFYKDKDGRYLGCNNAYSDTFGVTNEELVGKTVFDLWDKKLARKYHQMDKELMRSQKPQIYEYQVIDKNGNKLEVYFAKNVFYDSNGEVAGIVGAFIDISEHKRLEEELCKLNLQYQLLLDAAEEGVFGVDKEGKINIANKAALKILGYSIEEVLGKNSHLLWHNFKPDGEILDEASCPIHQTLIDGIRRTEDNDYFWTKDKSIIPVEYTVSPIIQNDQVNGAVIIFRDVSEKRMLEEKIRKYNEQLSETNANLLAILEGTNQSIWSFDNSYNIIYFNDVFRNEYHRAFGIWLEKGSNVIENAPDPYKKIWKERYDRVLRNERFTIIDEIETNYGKVHTQVSFNPIVKDGELIGGFCFGNNITEIIQMQQELQKQLNYLNAMNDLSDIIISEYDSKTILQEMVEIIGRTLEVDRCLLYEVSLEKNLVIGISEWLNQNINNIQPTLSNYDLDIFKESNKKILETKSFIESHFDNINETLLKEGSWDFIHNTFNIKSLLWFPILFQEVRYYLIALNTVSSKRTWDEKELALLELLSKKVFIAINKIQLFEEKEKTQKELVLSEKKFKTIAETINEMIALTDEVGIISYVSPASMNLFGYRPEEMIGKHFAEFLEDASASLAIHIFTLDVSQKIKREHLELKMKKKDGSIFIGELNAIPFNTGEYQGMLTTIRDITKRKQMENELRESESQFRGFFDYAADAIFIAEEETGIILNANQKACEMIKLPKEKIIGLHQKHLHPQNNEKYNIDTFKIHIREIKEKGIGTPVENLLVSSDGQLIPVEIRASRVIYQGKRCLMGIFRDITERKQMEHEILQAKEEIELREKQYRSLVENSKDYIIRFDKNHRHIFINSITYDLLNIRPEQLLNKSHRESGLFSPEQCDYWENCIDKVFETKEIFQSQFEFFNGVHTVYFDWILIPELGETGEVEFVLSVARDITKIKEYEKELLEAKDRAEESDLLKTAFLQNISHEIRTPLNGILGFAQLLSNKNISENDRDFYVEMILKSGDRLITIINNIIDISKIEAGTMDIAPTEIYVNEELKYLYYFFKPEIEAKGINFIINPELPQEVAKITTDNEKFHSIITNLIMNAIKFTDQGEIEIGCKLYDKDHILFYVRDTGLGIPKSRQDAIFDRFMQADIENKLARQGAGLGLSITKAYVEMLGGKIWVESEEGKGSTFYFILPIK